MAALLTPLARSGFSGPAPLFLVEANCRGVGKGMLLDVIARIVTGQRFAVCSYTSDREEMRKLITSIAVEGDRLVLLDNLDGPFGGGVIDMALTGDTWQGRLLGKNTTVRVPLSVVWFATGNNVSVVGDTARRVGLIRLETSMEHPERRGDFRHRDLLAWVGENRATLLSDALTILRAWHVAGRPDMKPAPWGSFGGWSDVVRNAVMWSGLSDPGETRTGLQERADTSAGAMRDILIGLEHLDSSRRGLTSAEIIHRVFTAPVAESEDWFQGLRAALEELVPRRDSRTLGCRFRSFRRRIFAGRYVDTTSEKAHGSMRWVVRPACELGRPNSAGVGDSSAALGTSFDDNPAGVLFDMDPDRGLPD